TVTVAGKTGLQILGKGKVVIDPPSTTALTLDTCTDCTVEKIRVQGGEPFGILLVDTSNCLFEKYRVDSSAQTGIRIEARHDNTSEKSAVHRAGVAAVTMSESAGDFTHDNLLSRCKLLQPAAEGLDIEGNDNTVDKCKILKPGGIGCQVDDATHGHDNH